MFHRRDYPPSESKKNKYHPWKRSTKETNQRPTTRTYIPAKNGNVLYPRRWSATGLNRCLIHCQHTFCGMVLVFPFVPWATLESFSRRQRVSTKHPRCTRPSPVSVPCPSASFIPSHVQPPTFFFPPPLFTSFRPFPETYPVNIVFYSLFSVQFYSHHHTYFHNAR